MKKRILHILHRLDQGGVENLIMNLYRNIDRQKYEFSFALMSGEKSWFDDEVIELGGRIYYFNSSKKNFKNIYDNLKYILIEQGPFDAVHSHCYFSSGILLEIAKKCGVPIRIAHAHDVYKGQKYSLYRKCYESFMKLLINKNATYKLGCSKQACEFVFGKTDDKTFVLRNGIDTDKFEYDENIRNEVRQKMSLQNNFVIGHVGRFEDQKDHEYLVRIFEKVFSKNDNARLMLIGEGSLKNEIIELTQKLNVFDKVLFLGNRQDVNVLMQAMDCFVFPSKYEGLGIVVVEACAAGLKCFVSNLVPDETKMLGDVSVLAKENIMEWVNSINDIGCYDRKRNEVKRNIEEYKIENVLDFLCHIYKGEF